MADHLSALVAQSVAESLNARSFSLPAEAERGWRIDKQHAELTAPTLTVVPGWPKTSTRLSRGGSRQHTIQMQVMVGRQHDGTSGETDPVAREDPIAGLAQEVEDFLAGSDSSPGAAIDFTDTDGSTRRANPTGVSSVELVEDWLTDGIFAMVVTVEYTVLR